MDDQVTPEMPICFGSPVVVNDSSAACAACDHASACVQAALCALDDLPGMNEQRLRLGIVASRLQGRAPAPLVESSRGVKRSPLTPLAIALIESLPARVRSQVRVLMERGWFDHARRELSRGRNPGERGWKRTLLSMLMAGSRSRAELEQALQLQQGMTPSSARSQLSSGLAIFIAGGLVQEAGGIVSLSRSQ